MHPAQDQQVFLQLILDNKGILFKISHSYCRNRNDREDLMQEIIYQLWKSGHDFDANRKFSTWMYRIATNACLTALATSRRRRWSSPGKWNTSSSKPRSM